MKKKSTSKGLMLVGSLRTSGITTYMKQGKLITRSSNSNQKRSNTMPQFVQRQKMRHSVSLWMMLKYCKTMFTQRPTAYNNFMSLANRLSVVYVDKLNDQASFLMPDIPVSDGTLPEVKLLIGEVNGVAALITDLKAGERLFHEQLWLYTAVQDTNGVPRVRFSMREVSWNEMVVVDGCLALVNEEFADEMRGWALVLVKNERCSPQTIVTRCTLYQQYTTEDALEKAADSYGGLTRPPFL
jgi:hypothetical protein